MFNPLYNMSVKEVITALELIFDIKLNHNLFSDLFKEIQEISFELIEKVLMNSTGSDELLEKLKEVEDLFSSMPLDTSKSLIVESFEGVNPKLSALYRKAFLIGLERVELSKTNIIFDRFNVAEVPLSIIDNDKFRKIILTRSFYDWLNINEFKNRLNSFKIVSFLNNDNESVDFMSKYFGVSSNDIRKLEKQMFYAYYENSSHLCRTLDR